jgi:ribonuclease J
VEDALRMVALGGLGEIGMNCMLLEVGGRLIVIDCGITFPEREPGIDVIHPDFDYLLDRADDVEAIVITHGHEDHIGALPYLLRDLDVPVHGPGYALSMVEQRLAEADLGTRPRLYEHEPREDLSLGPFRITPYRVTHSTPDCTGLIIRTPRGTVVHTGDFKIDEDPVDDEHFDAELLEEVGREGVDLLMSDSTNVETEGTTGEERPVGEAIERCLENARGRVVVCLFASNVHRLDTALAVARRMGRKVLLLGRSLRTHSQLAGELRMLRNAPDTFVSEEDAAKVPPHELMVLATGSQSEPGSALHRLAYDSHHRLRLQPGDEVVHSARIIPGRERQVFAMFNALERKGVRVWTRRDDPGVHVSGHACRDEQRRMIELTRPRAFLPVHGTYLHLSRHAALAREMGVEHTLTVENGAVVELDGAGLHVVDQVPTGRVHIQFGGEISTDVLRDRTRMADGGIVVVVVPRDGRGRLNGPVRATTRGVVDDVDVADLGLLEECERAVARAVRRLDGDRDDDAVEMAVTRAARRVFRDALGWRPLIHTVVDQPDR